MANLFENLPQEWLDSDEVDAVTPEIIEWIRSRQPMMMSAAKSGADSVIDTLGSGAERIATSIGHQPAYAQGITQDASGNRFNSQTGQPIDNMAPDARQRFELAQRQEAEQKRAADEATRMAVFNPQPQQTAEQRMASAFGDPNDELSKSIGRGNFLDRGKSYLAGLWNREEKSATASDELNQ